MATPHELLDRLESRHDELIHKLDELNAQIEAALVQFGKARSVDSAADGAAAKAANCEVATGDGATGDVPEVARRPLRRAA